MTVSNDIRIGLDIGGTSIKAVRMNAEGICTAQRTVPAGSALSRSALLNLVRSTVCDLVGGDRLVRLGIAVGGAVRADGSMPVEASNLPALAETPLPALFAAQLGHPCTVLNDAHAAMHGEAWLGAARGLRDVLMVTFGTGIGGGLMLGGLVRRGEHGTAGELGAWRLTDGGTFEALASPVNFERRTKRPLGEALLDDTADTETNVALDAIGRSLAAAHLLLDLEAIVIAGGIVSIGDPLRAHVEAAVRRHCPPPLLHDLRVVVSALGPYAGAMGAVAPSVPEPD